MTRSSLLRTIDDDTLYRQLQALLNAMPNFRVLDDDTRRWLGRLAALVKETGSVTDQVALNTATSRLPHESLRDHSVGAIKDILFRALAFAELGAKSAVQGAFIAAGNEFDAFSAVQKILASAKATILLVDPYMDASTLTDFAVLAPDGVLVRLLFGELERTVLFFRQNRACAVCDDPMAWFDCEIHHVEEHSKGGPTSIENGAAVHKKCHPKGSSATAAFALKFAEMKKSRPNVGSDIA